MQTLSAAFSICFIMAVYVAAGCYAGNRSKSLTNHIYATIFPGLLLKFVYEICRVSLVLFIAEDQVAFTIFSVFQGRIRHQPDTK